MPFGVTKAHALFKNYMNKIFRSFLMRLLRRGTHRKASPIGVPSIETRGERGKRSEKARLRRLSLGSLWFLTGLVNPKRLKPNLGFRVS